VKGRLFRGVGQAAFFIFERTKTTKWLMPLYTRGVIMDCPCGGRLEEGKSCYRVSRDNFVLIIEDLPAFKCTRCDKVYLSEESSEKIMRLTNRIEKDVIEIVTGKPSVNLYDYR
jgi:YgiT-type zinc finger domain-containing protein